MQAKVQVRIRLNAGRVDLSRVSIVPVDRANPIRESKWRGRTYIWPNRGDAEVIVKSGEHVVVCDHGTLIAIYGYAADSRKRGDVFAAVLRAKQGAKAAGKRVEADNAELVAEVVGSDAIAEMTAQMAAAGYSASRDPEKAAANVAAWLVRQHYAAAAAEEQKEEKREEQKQEQKQKASEASVVARIERLLSELAEEQKPAAPAEEQKPAEQPQQQAQQVAATATVDLQRGIIELPDGTILVRLWLVKFSKTSEYAIQKVERNGNGKGEIEEVRRINAEIASMLSGLRRRVNEELAAIAKLVTLESIFGKSSGMWLALDEDAVEQVKKLHSEALQELQSDPRFQRLPKEQQQKLLAGYRFYATQWWLPIDEAISLLQQLKTAVEAAKREKERKLQQLKKRKASRELRRYQALVATLEALQRKLEELAHLKP